MGVLRTVAEAVGVLFFLLVIIPILIAILGLMSNFWLGIYKATDASLGPGNPVTQITYYIYELSKWASIVTRYGFNMHGGTGTGGSNGCGS